MTFRVRRLRHNATLAAQFVGREGEITVDTTNRIIRVHDGVVPGGFPGARQDLDNVAEASSISAGKMTSAQAVEVGKVAPLEAALGQAQSDIAGIIADHTPSAELEEFLWQGFALKRIWVGNMGGNGNAMAATVPLAGFQLETGVMIIGIPPGSNTIINPTITIGEGSPIEIGDPQGEDLPAGVNREGRIHFYIFAGVKFRLLNPGRWMEQAVYDQLYPVNKAVQFTKTTDEPAKPTGITAIWTRITGSRYVRVADGEPGQGGSLNTSEQAQQIIQSSNESNGFGAVADGGAGNRTNAPHTHNVTVPAHEHTIEPEYESFVAWLRTA